ncbi:MAG: hypothetical protein NVSMB9_35390 [Isosphaeraceae bacterium]
MVEWNARPTLAHQNADDLLNEETITLLQEEIARLEAELRAHEEPAFLPAQEERFGVECATRSDQEQLLQQRMKELVGELATSQETVSLLIEQTRLYEEAAKAQQAEWEQLDQWVGEVERRVTSRDAKDAQLASELNAERRRSEALLQSAVAEKAEWDAQSRGFEREAQQLRDALVRKSEGSSETQKASIALLEENRRLQTMCARLQLATVETEDLRSRLARVEQDLTHAKNTLEQAHDERERTRNEHEAELAGLRSTIATLSLKGEESSVTLKSSTSVHESTERTTLDADERIRAFRQHLKELHEREAERRANRSLSSRLSRLWNHTGPT